MKIDLKAWGLCAGFVVLICLSSFWAFLKHQGYGLFAPEVLVLTGGVLILGISLGWVLSQSSQAIQAIVGAACVILWVDFQTEWFDVSQWPGILLVFTLVVTFLISLRTHGTAVLFVVFLAATFASLLQPSFSGIREQTTSIFSSGNPGSNVRILHLVLDEFIGWQSIPTDLEEGRRVRKEIQELFNAKGFRLFENAYSRHYLTSASLSNLFNFAVEPSWSSFYDRRVFSGSPMSGNKYFRELKSRGHRIQVFQTDYMDFCRTGDGFLADRCVTAASEHLGNIRGLSLKIFGRIRLIAGTYARLSFLWRELKDALRPIAGRMPIRHLSATSAFRTLSAAKKATVASRPGDVVFAHVLLPHFPYVYDEKCDVNPDVRTWWNAGDPTAFPERNSINSRRERYVRYLGQVSCLTKQLRELFEAMEAAGVFENTMILVHGDHGSRIGRNHPHDLDAKSEPAARDLQDGFSTLFAVKAPGIPKGVDSRKLSLENLLEKVIRNGKIPAGEDWAGPPYVYLVRGKAVRYPMAFGTNGVGTP